MTTPTDVINRAFDQIGRSDLSCGNIEDGTEGAQVGLRMYSPALRQLLRAAHWTFARKVAPMVMLGDATGVSTEADPNIGTDVIAPWVYEYAYPIDCMKVRFVPQNYLNPNQVPQGNISTGSTAPQTTVSQAPYGLGMRLIPSPFLVTSDTNYPIDETSNWQDTVGSSPGGRMVVMSNVNQAVCVYTSLMIYPSVWDPLFEQALVMLLAARLALPLARDQKAGLAIQDRCDNAVKSAVINARAQSANESAFPQTIDNIPDFIRARQSGGGGPGFGPYMNGSDAYGGCLFGGWDGLALGNGSVF